MVVQDQHIVPRAKHELVDGTDLSASLIEKSEKIVVLFAQLRDFSRSERPREFDVKRKIVSIQTPRKDSSCSDAIRIGVGNYFNAAVTS
jgi:hypothetical protein